ncbi:response regulator [Fulvivirgaceae bacterium PWU4]|uniref:Response regulator n=1 Tax=Chryseosolibacter histidini TaxID=2782349 RepID=A0AAP2DNX2_9BACT|nr:response regulator [Chryseosolibacter histidini]MBT1697559.1 response regulator [Chryseosolibacter histidini]
MENEKDVIKHNIVLVEDDSDACAILTTILTEQGYVVDSMPEGRMLLEPTGRLPDLYILDNSIPTIEGIALCKYLKLQPIAKQIPVLIMSADHGIMRKAYLAGAASFLPKPFDSEDLLQQVQALLCKHEPQLLPASGDH